MLTEEPGRTLEKPSRTVTVTVTAVPAPVVQLVLHAVMLAAETPTVAVVRSTAAGLTVTPAVCVTPPLTEIVFDSAFVELKVEVSTPLPLVEPLAGENVFEVPLEPKRTKPPEIGF